MQVERDYHVISDTRGMVHIVPTTEDSEEITPDEATQRLRDQIPDGSMPNAIFYEGRLSEAITSL